MVRRGFHSGLWILIVLMMVVGTAVLYRYALPRPPSGWLAVLPGSILSTALWTLARR